VQGSRRGDGDRETISGTPGGIGGGSASDHDRTVPGLKIEELYRGAYGRILASLIRIVRDFTLAEDAPKQFG
jgi:hypothetical protein